MYIYICKTATTKFKNNDKQDCKWKRITKKKN